MKPLPSFRKVLFCLAVTAMLSCPASAAVLWIEGEKPVQSTMNRHPWWYDQVKRDRFSGGDFMSNFSPEKAGEAEYELAAQEAGPYEFWVRANPVQASMSYRLNDGPWTPIDLANGAIQSENVAADGKPDLRFIAWFHVGKVTLKQGKSAIRFRMDSKNSNHGYLDCFVLANEPFWPHGILKPDQIAGELKRLAEENKGWFAFRPRAELPDDEKGFDLRELNEKFAGQGGYIQAKGAEFVHVASGEPVRFWGVNGPPADLHDRASAEPLCPRAGQVWREPGADARRLFRRKRRGGSRQSPTCHRRGREHESGRHLHAFLGLFPALADAQAGQQVSGRLRRQEAPVCRASFSTSSFKRRIATGGRPCC